MYYVNKVNFISCKNTYLTSIIGQNHINKPSADGIGVASSVYTCTVNTVSDGIVNATTNEIDPADSAAVLKLLWNPTPVIQINLIYGTWDDNV